MIVEVTPGGVEVATVFEGAGLFVPALEPHPVATVQRKNADTKLKNIFMVSLLSLVSIKSIPCIARWLGNAGDTFVKQVQLGLDLRIRFRFLFLNMWNF